MKSSKKYFLIGLLLLFCAISCVTVVPLVFRVFFKTIVIENYFYFEAEFLILVLSGILFLFSAKYYKYQMISIAILIFLYLIFVKTYPFIFSFLNNLTL